MDVVVAYNMQPKEYVYVHGRNNYTSVGDDVTIVK